MDADEQLAVVLVGDLAAAVEWDEGVILPGKYNPHTWHLLLDEGAKFSDDAEGRLLLHEAIGPNGAGVFAAVTGVEDDGGECSMRRLGRGHRAQQPKDSENWSDQPYR